MDIKFLIIIAAFLSFLLGAVAFRKNRKSRVNVSFAILCWISSIWATSLYFYEHPILFSSIVWIKIVYSIVFLLIPPFVYFAYIFPVRGKHSPLIPLVIYGIISLPFLWILHFTDWWVKDVIIKTHGPETILGPIVYSIIGIIWFSFVFWIFSDWWKKYRTLHGVPRLQLRYIALGYVTLIIVILITDVIVPLLTGYTRLFWLSPFAILSLFCFATYAIVRYRLMDIQILIRKSIIYSVLVILLLLIIVFLTLLAGIIFADLTGVNLIIIITIISLIITLVFHPLKRFIEKRLGVLIFSNRYDFKTATEKFDKTIEAETNYENLLKLISDDIIETLKVADVQFLSIERNTKAFRTSYSTNKQDVALERKDHLVLWLKDKESIIVADEIPFHVAEAQAKADTEDLIELRERLRDTKAALVVPIISYDHDIIAVILVGPKFSRDAFTKGDIRLLEHIADEVTPILRNAILYRDTMARVRRESGININK